MAAQQSICKTYQNCFCPRWRCLRCMMAFAGAFTTKQHPCIRTVLCTITTLKLKTWTKTVLLYKIDCWAAIPYPIWTTNVPYERKIDMLWCYHPLITITLFSFSILRDLGLNLGFSYCIITECVFTCIIQYKI